jgi:hypothetical protein
MQKQSQQHRNTQNIYIQQKMIKPTHPQKASNIITAVTEQNIT